MRRVAVAFVAILATLACISVPASARTEQHFTVITKTFDERGTENTFNFREQLFAPTDRTNQIGNDRVRCRLGAGEKFKCRAIVKFNGEYAGFGALFVNGNIGPDDLRLNVVGGTGDFEGAAGKVIAIGNRLHFALIY